MSSIPFGKTNACPECGAQMAADQHYCVECGARRGAPRFTLADRTSSRPAATPAATGPTVSRISAGLGLLATIAMLLLAVGVGVLIGNTGNSPQKAAQVNVKVNDAGGGSGGGQAASTDGATNTNASNSKSKGASNQTSSTTKVVVKAATKKELAAINKATGKALAGLKGTQKKAAPANQKLGAPCQDDEAGCTDGKFTGTFFKTGSK